MPEASGYKHDIFISYTHDDNSPIGISPVWVDTFHESLYDWLAKRRGFKKITIWRDKKRMYGNIAFDADIEDVLKSSAFFIALHSNNYLSSAYCQKELRWFHEFNQHHPGGLIDDPLIDISHESFIRLWERLSSWVDEEAESARIYWRLADTAESYAEGKAGPYHGTDLQVADDWWTENKPTQAWAKRYHSGFSRAKQFLELSKKEQERIEREKEQYQLTQKLPA